MYGVVYGIQGYVRPQFSYRSPRILSSYLEASSLLRFQGSKGYQFVRVNVSQTT